MSEGKFILSILKEEPKIKKKPYRKRGFTARIVEQFLEKDGDFAKITLTGGKQAVHVARALGRVIKNNYSDKVEYLGRDDEENVVYLKKVEKGGIGVVG